MPTRPRFPLVRLPPTRSKGTGKSDAASPAPPVPPVPPAPPLRARGADDEALALRLSIGRAGVGLELARPARLGCLVVRELTTTLPGARFPVDVSGGVPRFRHRRGILQTLQIEVGGRALERWAAPRLRGVVGARAPEVWVGVHPGGASVCVAATVDPEDDGASGPIVAFDVDALAEDSDVILVVKRARGTDLPAPATAMAIACADVVLAGLARREGAAFVIRRAAAAVARALLPDAGARVPASEDMRWSAIGAHAGTWILHAVSGNVGAAPSEDALRSREIATLLRDGDDALVAADPVRARTFYLEVLERAPRHGEVARRIVDIDARTPGRTEAALATLAEARQEEGVGASSGYGTTPGELLAQIGDLDAALASLERAGDTEPSPALSARAFEIAARMTRDAEQAARWLDRAIARSPRGATVRWLRVARRLELGRLEDALADVEHLEALARGARAKHAVWLRAGRAWKAAGLGARAGGLFERALRFAPDDPQALAGLGAALVGEGLGARGVALLTRAVELAERGGASAAPIVLALARALAERLDDLPTAIARASSIAGDAPEAPVARGLEGRWRARLGDLAGAALAYARLREIATSLAAPEASSAGTEDSRSKLVTSLLAEAAELSRTKLDDPLGAQRHLAAALRLRPHDGDLRAAYRKVSAMVARGRSPEPARDWPADAGGAEGVVLDVAPPLPADDGDAGASEATTASRRLVDFALAPEVETTEEDVRAASRVDELTRRLQAEPTDDAAADELAFLLERLGRGHELLALLSARLEDASPERRAALAPRARAALGRLAAEAQAAGRAQEAALYREAMESLSS
jgi:cellulose synthase operon protein C